MLTKGEAEMGTRSRVGIESADGSIKSIYIHFDGYFDGVGATLLKSYTEPAKVEALVALGDLSALGEEIGEKHYFGDPRRGWCSAYGRDRGETDIDARMSASRGDFLKMCEDCCGEYAYLFTPGGWVARRTRRGEFVPLAEAIAADAVSEDE